MRTKLLERVKGWRCNGSIYPMLNSWEEVDWVIDHTVPAEHRQSQMNEARRWAKIQMECIHHSNKFDQWPESFFAVRHTPVWMKRPIGPPWSENIRTIAQMVAAHGGTDSRAKCADLADLIQCIRLIGNYNEHDAEKSVRAFRTINRMHCYPDKDGKLWNPNDGKDAYEYTIGWEGSHVVYVRTRGGWSVNEQGDFDKVDRLTFESDMKVARHLSAPNEFSIEHSDMSSTCRLWWD